MDVLLITGAAGVGKSSVSWEVSEELKRRGLAHAVIDTDELDRVWPLIVDDDRRRRINVANLSSWWEQYHELGISRLVLVGVFVLLPDAIDWINDALPGATYDRFDLSPRPKSCGVELSVARSEARSKHSLNGRFSMRVGSTPCREERKPLSTLTV
jgi:hypothetical protein